MIAKNKSNSVSHEKDIINLQGAVISRLDRLREIVMVICHKRSKCRVHVPLQVQLVDKLSPLFQAGGRP